MILLHPATGHWTWVLDVVPLMRDVILSRENECLQASLNGRYVQLRHSALNVF